MSDTCACGRAAVLTRPFGSTMYLPLCRQCAGGLWYEPDPTAPKEATDALSAYRAHSGNHGLPAGHGAGMEDAARYRLWQAVERGLRWIMYFLIGLICLTAVGPTLDRATRYEVGTTMAREIGGTR